MKELFGVAWAAAIVGWCVAASGATVTYNYTAGGLKDGAWATATAAKLIQVYKDLEVLETAARQRLLAALGFGGEGLDADENLDQRDQGLTPAP